MTNSPKKRTTKKVQRIRLRGTKSGSDVRSLSAKLGWQQHTTRAALNGLRKGGCEVTCEKPATGRLAKYRTLSAPEQGAPTADQAHGA